MRLKLLLLVSLSVMPAAAAPFGAAGEEIGEYRGILLNQQCHARQPNWLPYAREHESGCAMMPQCFLSEYVLVMEGNRVVKLDRRGELLARRVLLTTKKRNDFEIVVRGILKESVLRVQHLSEVESGF